MNTPGPAGSAGRGRRLAAAGVAAARTLVDHRAGRRFLALLVVLGLCALGLLLMPHPDLAAAPRLAHRLGPAAPVAAVVLGAVLMAVLVPRTLITVAWGALFGPLQGAGYTLAAALLAAAIGFGVGRTLGRDFIAERLRGRLGRLDDWFSRQSVLGVITVRLLPVGGFGLVSYGYGTTGVRLGPYLVGSVLACAPSAFGYAALGAAVTNPGHFNWLAVAPASLGLFASLALARGWWRAERPNRPQRPTTP
ncbi:TVP38/TMEM64 family protein [Plantactinospora siamensis]|uniref:TVP38/TMEM64 family membrane protein n=1 Tax=Plantactinospora siamensis TaxID=555372 RepID=A0ABV6NZL6_9ACTN